MTLVDTPQMMGTYNRVAPPTDSRVSAFAHDGFLGPIRLFTSAECRRIAAYLRQDHPAPPDWEKGRAVRERFLFDLAIQPVLLSLVTTLLGEDVVLWGASAVRRPPGTSHSWHSDIESCAPDGGFVTAWIGIEETTRESALHVISRSHRLGRTVQEARLDRGVRRDLATAEAMLAAARDIEPDASLVQPDVTDGDVLLFDGRLWHGSRNARKRGGRLALLLQYAAADRPVRIPDLGQLDWPFRLRTTPRPPAILVSGTDRGGRNRLVPPPSPRPPFWPLSPGAKGLPMVTTAIHQFVLPVDHPTREWEMFPAFRGPTAALTEMSCHASVLTPGGHSPHPPHAHHEEELLIPLRGHVELVIARGPDDPAPRVERLGPGDFVYYPAGQYHTIRNPGISAVGYLMFKWYAPPSSHTDGAPTLSTTICRFGDLVARGAPAPFHMEPVLEGPTSYLGRLHAHVTTLQPGGGYAPHVDAYDVAIVTLSGTVETLSQQVDPLSVIYCGAGEPHGMRNIGTGPARYLVFELHAPGVDAFPSHPPLYARLRGKALRLGKRVARRIWPRLRPR